MHIIYEKVDSLKYIIKNNYYNAYYNIGYGSRSFFKSVFSLFIQSKRSQYTISEKICSRLVLFEFYLENGEKKTYIYNIILFII